MWSHIPFLPNPGSKVADVNMYLSDTPVVNTVFFETRSGWLIRILRYIETMEMLIDMLSEDDDDDSEDQLGERNPITKEEDW